MIRRFILPATSLTTAVVILVISIISSSKVVYSVENLPTPLPMGPISSQNVYVDYDIESDTTMFTGTLWPLRALKDKIVLTFTLDTHQKSLRYIDYANTRFYMGEAYLREGKLARGMSYIDKGQEYMTKALASTKDIDSYRSRLVLREISIASLKHRERLENLLTLLPDESRTLIVKCLDEAKLAYTQSRLALELLGDQAPHNPFDEK